MKADNIEHQVNRTLESLNGTIRAKAPANFYSKLESRLAFTPAVSQYWVRWLHGGIAAMLVMGLLNIYVLFSNTISTQVQEEDFTDFTEAYLDSPVLIEYEYE